MFLQTEQSGVRPSNQWYFSKDGIFIQQSYIVNSVWRKNWILSSTCGCVTVRMLYNQGAQWYICVHQCDDAPWFAVLLKKFLSMNSFSFSYNWLCCNAQNNIAPFIISPRIPQIRSKVVVACFVIQLCWGLSHNCVNIIIFVYIFQ